MSLTITFFSVPRASVSCSVSCTCMELEKPSISNWDILTSNYNREPIVLVIEIIAQTFKSLQTQRSDC